MLLFNTVQYICNKLHITFAHTCIGYCVLMLEYTALYHIKIVLDI